MAIAGAVQQKVLADAIPSGEVLLQARAATVDPLDIDLTVIQGSGPLVTLQHSRGGNLLRDDGIGECTSGWSVRGPNGDGILTAAHCSGLNQFVQPGVSLYSMVWRSQRRDFRGDVEYHTTSHWELAEFYANSTSIRDVTGIRPTGSMVGNSVCVYGRFSNVRTCNHTVEAVGVSLVFDGSVLTGNLVRVSGATTIGGDSGGGWSWNNTAWGIHTGIDGSDNAYFTPVQAAQSALGVTIMTK